MQFYNQFGYKVAWQLGSPISKEKVPKTYNKRQADKRSVAEESWRHLAYAWIHQPHLKKTSWSKY